MASIKEYNDKLKSLQNTAKMTGTMKMVSASKLRRAQDAQRAASLYAEKLKGFLSRMAASVDATSHPLLTPRPQVRRVLVVLFTSDRGLCGAFNNGIIRMTEAWLGEHRAAYDAIDFSFCGKRGFNHFRHRVNVVHYYEEATVRPSFDQALKIADDLSARFVEGAYDEVYLVYNVFRSALSQRPTVQKVLPVEAVDFMTGDAEPVPADYIFEPTLGELLDRQLPKILAFTLYYTLLENAAGEHGARMTAMDSATANAQSLTERYTLLRNRARQAAITTELTEIVAGAEAL
jgi:F-type H+-transporting ATPase subunit gamma